MLTPISQRIIPVDDTTYAEMANIIKVFGCAEGPDTHNAMQLKRQIHREAREIRRTFPAREVEREQWTMAYAHLADHTPYRCAIETSNVLLGDHTTLVDALIPTLHSALPGVQFLVMENVLITIGYQGVIAYHVFSPIGGGPVYRHDLLCMNADVAAYYQQVLVRILSTDFENLC